MKEISNDGVIKVTPELLQEMESLQIQGGNTLTDNLNEDLNIVNCNKVCPTHGVSCKVEN